jgi:hypothetical protein
VINAIYTQTQNCSGMPASARVPSAWTRALPMTAGESAVLAMGLGVDVQGTRVRKHDDATGFALVPGTSVWSPPT